MSFITYPTAVKSFSLAATLLVAACTGGSNPVRDIAVSAGAGPRAVETPDFVEQSRPQRPLDYIPVGTSAPPRPSQARTAEEVKKEEAEMDSVRAANEAAARAALRRGEATPPAEPIPARRLPPSARPRS